MGCDRYRRIACHSPLTLIWSFGGGEISREFGRWQLCGLAEERISIPQVLFWGVLPFHQSEALCWSRLCISQYCLFWILLEMIHSIWGNSQWPSLAFGVLDQEMEMVIHPFSGVWDSESWRCPYHTISWEATEEFQANSSCYLSLQRPFYCSLDQHSYRGGSFFWNEVDFRDSWLFLY